MAVSRAESDVSVADLRDSNLYANRELSWLDFNDRVLQLAEDEKVPLIERLKFLAIYTSNLDEFFMVRVAGVHSQIEARIDARGPDGLLPTQLMDEISRKVRALDARQANEFAEVVETELASHGIRIVSVEDSGLRRPRSNATSGSTSSRR